MNMTDRTRLEMEIEQVEKVRTPVSVRILILLLLLSLGALGVYTISLKHELSLKEQKITTLEQKTSPAR